MRNKPTYAELVNRVRELEKDTLELQRIKKALNLEHHQMLCIFNGIDQPVYVCDPETYELIFSNKFFGRIWGNKLGDKCYKVLQGRDSPCPFCTNDRILGENLGRTYIWEFQNRTTDRFFHCIDKAIHWTDGRIVRCEIAIDVTDYKFIQESLKKSEKLFRSLIESTPSAICIVDEQLKYHYVNPAWELLTGYSREQIASISLLDIIPHEMRDQVKTDSEALFEKGRELTKAEVEITAKSGETRSINFSNILIDYKGRPAILSSGFDITEHKKVVTRLNEKDKDLSDQRRRLEEANIALKVLIEHREEELKEIRDGILSNVKRLIYPYIEKMEHTDLSFENKTYLNIIKSNLEKLISPFSKNLLAKSLDITPTELQVADMIKIGKTTKEISELFNVSARAIEFHRNNLRKKLGLKNKKTNLRSYLLSLS